MVEYTAVQELHGVAAVAVAAAAEVDDARFGVHLRHRRQSGPRRDERCLAERPMVATVIQAYS